MKILCVLLVLALAFTLSGCASVGKILDVNKVLDVALPPTFRGDIRIRHKNPYTGPIVIAGGDLWRDDAGRWHYKWLVWRRDGAVSSGMAVFGTPPPNFDTLLN